ncbi:ABC transporter permease [Alkalispirochaeta sphaeroplastigenens]|uniref:ABC transporter permease n=1 Tax=Alkalispirochaeta sphaeroplastigenens TaxID=1187066 RepID=A0A2S4JU50_9SPIO|nr:ABC transporter permease [Alkalispirochaeta sphaeroplastigenens]POR03020.1 ABC transporter permease [Alkalispirochaeta sphaeroplastigenens]
MKRLVVFLLRRLWVPALLFCLWWGLSRAGMVHPYLIPSPRKVWQAARGLLESGVLVRHISVSLGRVFSGYGLTLVVALPLALIFHHWPRWSQRFSLILAFLRATPPLALIPMLILWFGIGEASKLAVIVMASFFPIFLNAYDGLERVEGRWHELALSLELRYWERLFFVLLPGALPYIITGLRIGFGYAWRALVGAELFAAAAGLGYLILDSQEMARTDRVVLGILTIGVLGLFFDSLLHWLARRLTPWSDPRSQEAEV